MAEDGEKVVASRTQDITLANMCTVNIQVDETVLRDKMPELDSTAAIRLWIQQLVDFRIHQMELEDEETMSIEEAREMTLKAIREEYARL